jgi:hypothetical protein
MRLVVLTIFLFVAFQCFSQPDGKIKLSAIVVDQDSVPIQNVAIMDVHSGKTVRTNVKGFFEAEILPNDSVFIYHIAYKRRFATERDNGRLIVLEPEVHELNQVDVNDKAEQERKNLEETVKEIKRLAPLRKDADYDMKSRQNSFIKQNGTHDKGFSPFFGPSTSASLQKVAGVVAGTKEKRLRKKLTSHYHLVKRKPSKKKE